MRLHCAPTISVSGLDRCLPRYAREAALKVLLCGTAMEIEIRFIGEELEGPLEASKLVPESQLSEVILRGAPMGSPVYTRHLTVFTWDDILFAAEDTNGESNGASEALRLLSTLHSVGAVTITSINGVQPAREKTSTRRPLRGANSQGAARPDAHLS